LDPRVFAEDVKEEFEDTKGPRGNQNL